MKKLLMLLLFTNIMYAQSTRVNRNLIKFTPGELIVKLKDNINAGVTYAKSGEASTNLNIGELLGIEEKITSTKVLFHEKSIKASIANKQKLTALYASKSSTNPNNGFKKKVPVTMKSIFVLKTTDTQENILLLVEELKNHPDVEFAEPNYIYSLDNFKVDNIITAAEAAKMEATSMVTVNDPLYSQQTGITQTNIDDVWDTYGTGDRSQIVAVIDTGVDYTHPDLIDNIWVNTAELNGITGFDDDGNGYIDDVRGWDFINVDNTPLDDNIHGTHVAGVIGAVGNNGIGIAGAAWNVQIMPIKVMQSTGVGNITDIAAGIEYAANNGATIINMSIGGYGESATMQAALENAFSNAVLVAAAGNDKKCIGPGKCPDDTESAPLYPGAYNYVVGVEDGTGDYDNYDVDGPVATRYSNLLNYEVKAHGSSVMSTIPGGGYANLTGTSMATPLVAGGLALYLQQRPNESQELMFGNLINTSTNSSVDFLAAIAVTPTPKLAVLSASTRDTISSQNGNGFIESGEIIEILPLVKNYWGPTEDVRLGIAFAEFEDTTKATITTPEIAIGSITAYASLQDLQESLKITIADNVANNVSIKFVLTAWSGPDRDYLSDETEFVINVKNAILLSGVISTDYTFLASKEYLIADNIAFSGSATVTIEPGTVIKVSDGKSINFLDSSSLICNGTKEDRIIFRAENVSWGGLSLGGTGDKSIKFTNISGVTSQKIFNTAKNLTASDVLVSNSKLYYLFGTSDNTTLTKMNYDEMRYGINIGSSQYMTNVTHTNITNTEYGTPNSGHKRGVEITSTSHVTQLVGLNILNNDWLLYVSRYSNYGTSFPVLSYLGSSDVNIVRSRVTDLLSDGDFPNLLNLESIATVPNELAHGIVWKVLVDGKDAQDEYSSMEAIGVGSHTFKVYFNRAMDTTVDPQVSYGVTIPYNQKIIPEAGTWSADGKIYTVIHDVNIGAADGINRIRVQDAQDLDYFKIPVEDSRFNMLVQSAGSASTGWFSTAGLGKIDLEWTAPSAVAIDDALGYNMYRYIANDDGTFTDPVKLNESLIVEDTDDATTGVYYTDYNVVEGQTYYYKYNILRTSFQTTDYSSVVSTAPLTSTLGDSNGDFSVNVMDLVQNVDYILGNNPSPYIFIAGDVNNDQNINVLDIVGTVDIILNPTAGRTVTNTPNSINYYSNTPVGDAVFNWEGNDLFVTSNYDVGGIQLAFNQDFEYTLSDNLPGVERLNYTQDDAAVLMLYSFNNTIIANTKTKILTRANVSQEFDINLAVVGTTNGEKLNAVLNNGTLGTIDAPFQSNQLELLKLYPNPSDGIANLQYYLPELMDGVTVKVYDIQGRLVWVKDLENQVGKTDRQLNLDALKAGNYIVLMIAHKDGGVKYISHKMLILK